MDLLRALPGIREVVVSKIIDFLLDKLASSDFLQFATEKHVHREIDKLKMELMEIRAVLDDAEERQIKDKSVKIWLANLQNLAYDLDDILDEFATEIFRRNLMMERRGSSSKKPRLISFDSFDAAKFNREMMSKIRDVSAKLKDLQPQKKQLHLRMTGCMGSKRIEQRQQPTSVEIETHVYGRDKDKETILELLKRDDEANFVIPIVGMGGIGKTTLAQLVYNDATVRNLFELKAWVCVSDDFDIMKITKAILQSVTSKQCDDNDLNKLQEKLKEELSKRKFLIVLDDVWNENYHNWTILQSPFLARNSGSKILVTTRSFAVSSTMGASRALSLEVLSEDDCLSVFAQQALGAKDFGGHPHLKEVAQKIVRKCNGLPLAAKTLGGLLRTNVDHDAWNDVLESEIWLLSEDQCGLIPALQLSYHHLPPHLKRCFAYCSVFPKDYEFKDEEVILLWRAEGFLQEAHDKQSIEDLGRKYFKDLLSRCLLQRSNKYNSLFVMHDLINDLAQSVAGDLCFRIEDGKQIPKYTRHLSYIGGRYDGIKKFNGISEAQYLRTFLPLRLSNGPGNEYYFVTNNVLTNLLPGLRCLRVLSLESYKITVLSDFIKDLKHLRYLNLSGTGIKSLPESVSTLYNLETLLLSWCSDLKKLPANMENLVNLCHLDIRGARALEGMTSNFGTLTNLQTLSNFVLGKGKGDEIRELKNLLNLKGDLCISGLEYVIDTQDAWMATLHDKSGLVKLELEWSRHFENRSGEVDEKELLNFLQPSRKLRELSIKCYSGAMFPNWVKNPPFNDLVSLCLEDCWNCISLPSIGQLSLLEKVCIKGFHGVTSVGVEFFGENTSNAFPSLQILQFEDMPRWVNWNFPEVDVEAIKFPGLRQLVIKNCPKLVGSIPEYLPSLGKLVIFDCQKLIISIQSLPKLSELEIRECQEVVYKGFADDCSLKRVYFSNIPKFSCPVDLKSLMLGSVKVESLEIDNCAELCSLQANHWGLLTQSMILGNLRIANWPQLVSIGAEEGEREEWMMHLRIPCSVGQMMISSCGRLEKLSTTLHSMTSLTVLMLSDCPQLISLSKSNLLSNLKILDISKCAKLVYVWDEGGQNVEAASTCLVEELYIRSCKCLVGLSSRGELPTRLKKLRIRSCPSLEYIAHEIRHNSSLEFIEIGGCNNMKYLPQGLSKLSHLQKIYIYYCSNLTSFPGGGLPVSNLKLLSLQNCKNLQALPDGIHNFNYLEELVVVNCSLLISFPEEGIPTNLRKLVIEGPTICKQVMEWGLHKLTSLRSLSISNWFPNSDAVLFQPEEIVMMLPCSLTHLSIASFGKLETLSSNGFRNLTSLEELFLYNCPNLKSLLEIKDTLPSLLHLEIWGCPVLKERCEKDKGPEWPNIAHIPFVFY